MTFLNLTLHRASEDDERDTEAPMFIRGNRWVLALWVVTFVVSATLSWLALHALWSLGVRLVTAWIAPWL